MLTQQRQRRNTRTKKSRRKQARAKTPIPASLPGTGSLLAAAVAIAGGTQAYAEVIMFLNPDGPDHFDWTPSALGDHRGLDIILSAADQTGATTPSPTNFVQRYFSDYSYIQGHSGSSLQITHVGDYPFLLGVNAGELIPSGLEWINFGMIYYTGYGMYLPEGEPTYLGVRFDPGDGNHYGWIGVVRTGVLLDGFAWGYETEAGVPIAAGIPTPGTLALLAFGALPGLARSRKRKKV